MVTATHPRVVLRVSRKNIPGLLGKAKIVYNAMLAAASTFTSPLPTMVALLVLIQALDAAQQSVGKNGAAVRNLKADALVSGLGSERSYVQTLVDLNPEQAQALAELAGMSIAIVGKRVKAIVDIKQGAMPGTADVEVNLALLKMGRGKARKTTIHLRATMDGGKTHFWTQNGPLAKATITGVPPGSSVGIEACITDSGGTTDWTPTLTKLIH